MDVPRIVLPAALPPASTRRRHLETPGSAPVGGRTDGADAADATASRPACPRCHHRRSVVRWRHWAEHGEWIWLCTRASCAGHLWRRGRPRAACYVCAGDLWIEQHAGTLGYYCRVCTDFSQ